MGDYEMADFSTVDAGMTERPASDPIAMERARARLELAMFGRARPAMLGRYVILEPIAGGGMGLVYSGYDPELERKVALKVLHPNLSQQDRAHERLVKEARALARLDHPNVVPVYDILSQQGEIVIVIALLEGETLERWQERTHPALADVLDAYIQAGEGLAAAHSVDVIHRDFKPSNAIISSKHHVRVFDFGLARFAEERPERHVPSSFSTTTSDTLPGAFLGTLSYASPEQLAGLATDARTDQFSFCVALHRALEGVQPFAGTTVGEVLASIEGGVLGFATDGRRIPPWLREVIRRGLARDAKDRFGSMEELLAELRRPRGWKRWKWPTVTAGLVVVAAVAAAELAPRAHDASSACDGAPARVASAWASRRTDLVQRISTAPNPFAHDIATRVAGGIDAFSRRWSVVHRDACLAHRRGAESDALLDRKMRCLDHTLGDLEAAVDVLEQPGIIDRDTEVVAGLPPPEWCADAARLLDDADPPASVAIDWKVRQIRANLGRAAALEHVGRSDDAVTLAQVSADAANATGYQPVIAETNLALGRILIGRDEFLRAAPILDKARRAALATGHQLRLGVEAGARQLYVDGTISADVARLERDLAYLIPMSDALVDDHFARPLLFNNAAEVYRFARRPDDARRYLRLAQQALGNVEPDVELTAISRNLATLASDPSERLRLANDTWQRLRTLLGDHHPRTLQAQAQYAAFQSDVRRADELLTPVCAEYSKTASIEMLLDCEIVHGFLAGEVGHAADARAAYGAILAATDEADSDDRRIYHLLATGEIALADSNWSAAEAAFRAVIATRGHSEEWWYQQQVFQSELGLGVIAIAHHQPSEARQHLEAALTGYTDVARANPIVMYTAHADKARRLLASLPERDRE